MAEFGTLNPLFYLDLPRRYRGWRGGVAVGGCGQTLSFTTPQKEKEINWFLTKMTTDLSKYRKFIQNFTGYYT